MQKTTVMLAGGGTGGHVFPLIPVIRELKKRDAIVAFIGPEEFSLDVLRAEDIPVHAIISAGKFRRYVSLKTIWDVFKIPLAIVQSIVILRAHKPDVLLGKGGYGSGAPVIAARILGIPIVLHESDTIPGLANRFLQRFAGCVLLAFKQAQTYFNTKRTIVTGNPVRTKYMNMKSGEAKQLLGLETNRKIIFIVGGSQGARSLNKLAKEALPLLLDTYAIIISTGSGNINHFKGVNVNNAVIRPFLEEKEYIAALLLADLVVSRAGAGGIFDIAAMEKPSILVPINDSTGGHQKQNARRYEETEAAIVLDEITATGQTLTYAIESVLNNMQVAKHMSQQAQKFATLDSAKKITDTLLTYANKN